LKARVGICKFNAFLFLRIFNRQISEPLAYCSFIRAIVTPHKIHKFIRRKPGSNLTDYKSKDA